MDWSLALNQDRLICMCSLKEQSKDQGRKERHKVRSCRVLVESFGKLWQSRSRLCASHSHAARPSSSSALLTTTTLFSIN